MKQKNKASELEELVKFYKKNSDKNFERALTNHLIRALETEEGDNLGRKIFALYLRGAIAKHIYLRNSVKNEQVEDFNAAYHVLKYKKLNYAQTEILLYTILTQDNNTYLELIDSNQQVREKAVECYVKNGLLKDFNYKEEYIPLDALAVADQIEFVYDVKIKGLVEKNKEITKIEQPTLNLSI
jgi:hypothetical protein